MPQDPDELDEPDFRQPVIDTDVVLELDQLKGEVQVVAGHVDEAQQELREIKNLLEGLSWGLYGKLDHIEIGIIVCLLLIFICAFGIVGTLRHWF
jgi:hypothetical protein